MSLSHETQQKVKQFAKEQSRQYIEEAELTYLEQLKKNTNQAKSNIGKQLTKFKISSEQSQEAQSDLAAYMTDYIADLMEQGMSEKDAFVTAQKALSSQETDQYADMNARFKEYYLNVDPAEHEIVGLVYGGLTIIGLVIGAFVAFLASGGRAEFLQGGWVDTLIGAGVGIMVGVGLALISNATIVYNGRK